MTGSSRSEGKLRVGLFGNVCNNLLFAAQALRAHSHRVEPILFVDQWEARSPASNPYLHLADGERPDWIVEGDYNRLDDPGRSALRADAEKAGVELIICSAFGPILCQFGRIPYVFFSTGADLAVYPFVPKRLSAGSRHVLIDLFHEPWWRQQGVSWPRRAGHFMRRILDRGRAEALDPWAGLPLRGLLSDYFWEAVKIARLQRSGIAKAEMVLAWDIPAKNLPLRALGVPDDRVHRKYPRLVVEIPPAPGEGEQASLPFRPDPDVFTIFIGSRMVFRRNWLLRHTGNNKRNDLGILGCAEAVKRSGRRMRILIPDTSISEDVDLARVKVREAGLEGHVEWIRPPAGLAFSQNEMMEICRHSDVVLDDFGAGWMGSLVLESVSVGTPVVSNVEWVARNYGWIPVLQAKRPDEIAKAILYLSEDAAAAREVSRKGLEWIEEYHSFRASAAFWDGVVDTWEKRAGLQGARPPAAEPRPDVLPERSAPR